MNQSIIFFDIDGTLITEETYIIPNSTIEAIKKVQANGHLAFINTGRPISEIDDCIKELNFDGYVCGCGTYINLGDKELFYKSIGSSLSKKLAFKLRDYNIDGILEGKNGIYYDHDNNIASKEVIRIKKRHIKVGFYKGKTFDDENIDFDKLVIWTNETSNFDAFYEEFKSSFDFIHRGEGFYELVPLGFSKASGIEFLINHLNIPFENTYAIGDSTNDLPMLQYVKNSIAMGNSHPKLFDLVSYVTKDIEDDGIAHALEHYGLI
ncbi:Cof-type HAD-IIB family hydrolase [Clostridium saccharobutylicum]|uniref:Putative bifunctional phosphatase/peptidyl-prolyl cis-trans isomerase n=1 Tax=Clostridium saccharobutylicum TaxID=169679 RepID=A0A1S8N293_CLOSA|nr:Cof-type HAD-IIB family hydrolase [Clostridium saccharobutylicum]OOM10636.1 putative bifunctional phosphatase/peptidyl-prolyl cis-trans isomerase [Clostridium saccharobutylicum]